MLSYHTPATLARDNAIAAKHMAERHTGINSKGAEDHLSEAQSKDFAAALEKRKHG